MKSKQLGLTINLLLFLGISACSTLQVYFPDKEKEYQLKTEIPALSIPPDLSDHAIQSDFTVAVIEPDYQIQSQVQEPEIDTAKGNKKDETIYIKLIEYSDGVTHIRISDTLDRLWRTVGKALSRNSIEIIDRNELERVYYVLYDAQFEKVEDGSLWDEALFIFGANPAQEKEFRIKLTEYGGFTEVIVFDDNDVPLSTGGGLKLLNLMYKTIKEDLAN